VRKLTVTGTTVNLRHCRWGKAREASFPKDELLNVCQGHVMADPA